MLPSRCIIFVNIYILFFSLMNFITRNLGWILLLLFFIFMLFIISSNNVETSDESQSWSIISNSWTIKWELDEIAEKMKLDNTSTWSVWEEDVQESEKKKWFFSFLKKDTIEESNPEEEQDNLEVKENKKQTESEKKETGKMNIESQEDEKQDDKEEKKGLLSKLFWWSKDEEESNIVEEWWSIEVENQGSINGKWEDKQDSMNDTSVVLSHKNDGLTKKSENKKSHWISKIARDIAPEIYGESELPWINLETAVWNTYKVWVYSLKLNNKYFSETLGYLKKWDTLLQKTAENSFGCFNVEVISSENKSNNTKLWYVCKKWLEADNSIMQEANNTLEVEPEQVEQTDEVLPLTNIWDLIIIEKDFSSIGWGVTLVPGDVVDQMTVQDESWCFIGLVRETNNIEFMGRVLQICQKDL